MKQSTKLLSLVLALVMAFGCMSVIGNATLVKSEVSWDNIDDAQLTAEQVADLALDLVDNDLLAGMETIDLSIIGKLRLDSIDNICADVTSLTNGFVWAIGKGLLIEIHPVNHQFTKKCVGFLFTFSLAFLYYCMYNFRMNIFWICRGFFE